MYETQAMDFPPTIGFSEVVFAAVKYVHIP